MQNALLSIRLKYICTHITTSASLLHPMKHQHRHGHRTRHGYGHVDTCNVQNIERNTGVVSVSNIDTDACRTPNTTRDWSVRASHD